MPILTTACEDTRSNQDDPYHGRIRERQQLDYSGKPVLITQYQYDHDGKLIRELVRDSSAVGVRKSEKLRFYDGSRLIRIEAYDPPGTLDYTWKFEYTGDKLVREFGSLPNDSVFEEIVYVHDSYGNVISETNTSGTITTTRSFSYDSKGRLSEARSLDRQGEPIMSNLYIYRDADTLADTVKFIRPHGPPKIIAYQYDEYGHKIAEKEPRPDGSYIILKRLGYDKKGNILFEEDRTSGNRVDYLYQDGNLTLVKYKMPGGRTVGLVFYE